MNIKVLFEGVFLGVKRNETKNGVYYNISVECDGECGILSCTEEVFKLVQGLEKYHMYSFDANYNSNYKNLRVIGVK